MKRKIRLTEGDLHRIIKKNVEKVLKEAYYHDKGYPRFFVEVFELDGDAITSEKFSNLKDACMWAKSQVEGINAPYKGYASEVFFMDGRETGHYYGNC